MLDGIGKDVSVSLAIFLSVLLTSEYNGLSSINLVDAVNDGYVTIIDTRFNH